MTGGQISRPAEGVFRDTRSGCVVNLRVPEAIPTVTTGQEGSFVQRLIGGEG